MTTQYKRILLKLSGESLMGNDPFGINRDTIMTIVRQVKEIAGLGVAFHAKPKVQQQAQVVVNFADLTALLCLLTANDRIS